MTIKILKKNSENLLSSSNNIFGKFSKILINEKIKKKNLMNYHLFR